MYVPFISLRAEHTSSHLLRVLALDIFHLLYGNKVNVAVAYIVDDLRPPYTPAESTNWIARSREQ